MSSKVQTQQRFKPLSLLGIDGDIYPHLSKTPSHSRREPKSAILKPRRPALPGPVAAGLRLWCLPEIADIVRKAQHHEALQGIRPSILNIGLRHVAADAAVLFEHVIDSKGQFAPFVFKELFADGNIPQPVVLVEALREAIVILVGHIAAQHEALKDNPVEPSTAVQVEILGIAGRLDGVGSGVPAWPQAEVEVKLGADIAGQRHPGTVAVVVRKILCPVHLARRAGIDPTEVETEVRLNFFQRKAIIEERANIAEAFKVHRLANLCTGRHIQAVEKRGIAAGQPSGRADIIVRDAAANHRKKRRVFLGAGGLVAGKNIVLESLHEAWITRAELQRGGVVHYLL